MKYHFISLLLAAFFLAEDFSNILMASEYFPPSISLLSFLFALVLFVFLIVFVGIFYVVCFPTLDMTLFSISVDAFVMPQKEKSLSLLNSEYYQIIKT